MLFACIHQGESRGQFSRGWHVDFLEVGESASVSRREDFDVDHVLGGARDEHVLRGLDDSVTLFKSHHVSLPVVIRVVQIDVDAPLHF